MDLFFAARLDEEEVAATPAERRFPSPWRQADEPRSPLRSAVSLYDARDEGVAVVRGRYAAAHIGLHDPARTLRQIEADRELLTAYSSAFGGGPDFGSGYARGLEDAIRHRLLEWSDHPDYDREWAP
jgi:hypothetical protein